VRIMRNDDEGEKERRKGMNRAQYAADWQK
jgi:hypothetical protein